MDQILAPHDNQIKEADLQIVNLCVILVENHPKILNSFGIDLRMVRSVPIVTNQLEVIDRLSDDSYALRNVIETLLKAVVLYDRHRKVVQSEPIAENLRKIHLRAIHGNTCVMRGVKEMKEMKEV